MFAGRSPETDAPRKRGPLSPLAAFAEFETTTQLTSLVGREDSVASIVKRLMEEAVHEPSAATDP